MTTYSKLYGFQKDVLRITSDKTHVAYYLDMGLGKTFVGAEKLYNIGNVKNLLICQKSKIDDWIYHFCSNYCYKVYDLTRPSDLDLFLAEDEECIGVINFELAWRREKLRKLQDFTLMIDESSEIQNHSAKKTRFILRLNPSAVILLSGTPTSGKYENLWSQAKLLGWNISRDHFNKRYINWYKLDVGVGYLIDVVNKRNPYKKVDEMKDQLREHGAVFMKTEDVHELPEQNFIDIKVEKTGYYRIFEEKRIVYIDNEAIVGDTKLGHRLRLRQLASQYSNHKISAFEDLLNSTGDRVLVFYNFNSELEQLEKICKKLERPISYLNGSIKDLKAYNDEEDSVTLCQYQTGSMAHNLQKSNKIVYFSPPESSANYEQSQKRIHRIGQSRPCFYYRLITRNSIEEDIYDSLEKGIDYNDNLFI